MRKLVILLLSVLASSPCFAQSEMRLTRVDVSGTHRLSAVQILAMAGLKTGTNVTAREVNDASKRLADSGFFTNVTYRARNFDRDVEITFELEEAKWNATVLFDNFLDHTDAKLTAAVAAVVPTFDGSVPEASPVLDVVAKALEKAARDSGQPGTVDYLRVVGTHPDVNQYRFHLQRASGPIPICSINVTGVTMEVGARMSATLNSLFGRDYSRDIVQRFAAASLPAVAGTRGYLRARYLSHEAARQTTPVEGCVNGAAVTIAVEPGLQYMWHQPVWEGLAAFGRNDVEPLLPLKEGDIADLSRINDGARSVLAAYRKNGYVAATLLTKPAFDDAQRQVTYSLGVTEGKQYRMGALTIAGVDEAVANDMRRLWKMPQGAVFDDTYATQFVGTARSKFRSQLAAVKNVDISTRRDDSALTVGVTVTFRQ